MKMPISKKNWYPRKRPTLQIRILRAIGLEGQLSKRMAEVRTRSDYSDVSDAIDKLLRRKRIKISSAGIAGRRDKRYYGLTGKGLEAFVDETTSPEEFWKAIIWYCRISEKELSINEFEKYYDYFESKYLGHSGIHNYFFQSLFFNKLINNWFEENCTSNINEVSLSQKILECIAMNRAIPLQELVKKIGASEESIKEVLNRYTMKLGYPAAYHVTNEKMRGEYPATYEHNSSKYLDFISHILIISKTTNQDTRYELSLFGIMLTIAIIRYHHIGIDSSLLHNPNSHIASLGLFYEDITLKEYYERIVSNYQRDKLPLIFGKWEILKKELGLMFLYDNFDFLFYEKAFSVNMDTTIWLGGNKEFYDNIQRLAYKVAELLNVIYVEGRDILEGCQINKYMQNRKFGLKILPVYKKLNEIEVILNCANSISFPNDEQKEVKTQSKKRKSGDRNTYRDEITTIEKVFSDELTFLFYLNLNNIAFIPSRYYLLKKSPPSIETIEEMVTRNLDVANDLSRQGSPKKRLISILQKDSDIREKFTKWMQGSMNYQEETSKLMHEHFDEISIKR
jgi:hypothetical protein